MSTSESQQPSSSVHRESTTDTIVRQWERERPDLDLEAFGILLRMRGLAMLMECKAQKTAQQLGIKMNELWLLYALRREGAPYQLRPTDIFRLLNVTSGTITYRIDRLVKTGLVERVPDPTDRRSVLIQLTDKGKELIDMATETTASNASTMLQPLLADREATTSLVATLRLLGEILDREIPPDENPLLHNREGLGR